MSAIARPRNWISPEDYLEGEKASEVRHEYVDGAVYAMAGASDDHNRIAGNIFAELRERLRGRRCEPFMADMRAKMPASFGPAYYYPDVLVACDPTDNAKYFRERPAVIFEVMSPETERTDRQEKTLAYQQIPSLTIYVLVEQDAVALTLLRRADPGWSTETVQGRAAVLRLPEIGVEIPLELIYERTGLVR
jgi:Uma2 family endonuclease